MLTGKRVLAVAICLSMGIAVAACGGEVESIGTNTLTVAVTNLVGAQDSELRAELGLNVDYLQQAPTWEFLTTTVTASPFGYRDTVQQLPEGEFTLSINAGSDEKSQAAEVKGQGCEMNFTMGMDETVTITIDGLNEFGDKGYGPCNATRQ